MLKNPEKMNTLLRIVRKLFVVFIMGNVCICFFADANCLFDHDNDAWCSFILHKCTVVGVEKEALISFFPESVPHGELIFDLILKQFNSSSVSNSLFITDHPVFLTSVKNSFPISTRD